MARRTYRELGLEEASGTDGATSSMVLGIASLAGLFVIFAVPFALVTAPLGLLLGITSLVRGQTLKRGRAIAGVACSAIAIIAIVLGALALNAIGNGLSWGDD